MDPKAHHDAILKLERMERMMHRCVLALRTSYDYVAHAENPHWFGTKKEQFEKDRYDMLKSLSATLEEIRKR